MTTERDLLAALLPAPGRPELTLLQAVVDAVNEGAPPSVDVLLGGSTTVVPSVRHLDSYAPEDGDTVWCLQQGTDLIVIGRLADDYQWHTIGAAGEPAFANSWVNYGGSDMTARFRRIGKVVYLTGTIKSGNSGSAAFTLPAGYRPSATLRIGTDAWDGTAGRVDGLILITSAGVVTPYVDVTGVVNPIEEFSLHTSFIAEQ